MATENDADQNGILAAQETSTIKEPSKISPDEERPIAENEAPMEDAPLTKEQFAEQMQLLAERARAAGLNPIKTLAHTYIKQGMGIIEGVLASLENVEKDNPKKKG